MFERCLYFNTNNLVRKVNAIWRDAFKEVGLSPSHAYLIRLVLAQPGLSQRMIADELNLEKSTVTRFIDKMEAEGYVTRTVAEARQTSEYGIYPTSKAQEIAEKLESIGDSLYQQMLDTVGESELKNLVHDLRETSARF